MPARSSPEEPRGADVRAEGKHETKEINTGPPAARPNPSVAGVGFGLPARLCSP